MLAQRGAFDRSKPLASLGLRKKQNLSSRVLFRRRNPADKRYAGMVLRRHKNVIPMVVNCGKMRTKGEERRRKRSVRCSPN